MSGFSLDPFNMPSAPKTVQLDPGTQGLINQQLQQAQSPSQTYSDQLNKNVDASQGLAGAPQQMSQQAAGLGMNPAMFGAIRNVYAKQAGQDIYNIKKQNDLQAQLNKGDYMHQMSQSMLGMQANQVRQSQVLTDIFSQQEAARAGFINEMFQLGSSYMMMKKFKGLSQEKPIQPNVQDLYDEQWNGNDYNYRGDTNSRMIP